MASWASGIRGSVRVVAGLTVVALAVGVYLVSCGSDGRASETDRAASWLDATDDCNVVARYAVGRPRPTDAYAAQIPALTTRADSFTALSCRSLMSIRGEAAVWAFTSIQARDAAIEKVHRSDRGQLCRLDHTVILMKALNERHPARAFCRSARGQLG
jgi:hypothetical protein